MLQNRTVLEVIGISDSRIKQWKSSGLKISYPMESKTNYFKSKDGLFIYSADKFFPELTKKKILYYTKNPLKFRIDFLKSLRFYTRFYESLYPLINKTEILEDKEKTIALLSLLYLFQSAMDNHYYHYDRYLAYENYPQTPVGYWWNELKILYTKATKKKVSESKPPEDFLKILSFDKEFLKKLKLSKNDTSELNKVLKIIKMFEKTQEDEARMLYGTYNNESKLFDTGLKIWSKLCECIKNNPNLIESAYTTNVKEIMKLHPIIGIRKILSEGLCYFNKEIICKFEEEIKRWL